MMSPSHCVPWIRDDAWKMHSVLLALSRLSVSGSYYFKNSSQAGVAFMEVLLCAKAFACVTVMD